jgi:allantoinase
MTLDVIFRGGHLVTADAVVRADVGIRDGVVEKIETEIADAATEVVDASGLHLFPGAIDAHVHFNEPGRTEWEGFASGSSALSVGGGTAFFDMPLNSSPATLDVAAFDAKRAAATSVSRADFALWAGLTPANTGELRSLAARGAVGFKAFMCDSGIDEFARADVATLRDGMRIAADLGAIVAVHAESQPMIERLTAEMRRRGNGWRDYLDSRPIQAEIDAIGTAIDLARETGAKLHVVHVSTAAGVDSISSARSKGVDVSAETCPHYLLLTDVDQDRLGAIAKCSPPLRSKAERDRLWDRLADGSILFVGSDHSPAPANMKQGDDAFSIWGGIAGVQSTLTSLLCRDRKLALPLVGKLTSTRVADRFGFPSKGRISVGYDADLVLVDLKSDFVLTRDMLLDRHRASPYVGRRFDAKVRQTWLRGRCVARDGKVVGPPAGRLITPERAR